MPSIVNHQKDENAVPLKDGYITLKAGLRKRIVTTKGWRLNVEWVDGTSSWIPLSDLKESNPIEVAEYAIAHTGYPTNLRLHGGHLMSLRNVTALSSR